MWRARDVHAPGLDLKYLYGIHDSSATVQYSMELPLVDVNVETVKHTWPLLMDAVKRADFVALDLVSVGDTGYKIIFISHLVLNK